MSDTYKECMGQRGAESGGVGEQAKGTGPPCHWPTHIVAVFSVGDRDY